MSTLDSAAPVVLVALVLLPALTGALLLLAGPVADRLAGPVTVATSAVVAAAALLVALPAARPSVRAPFVVGSDLALAVDGVAAVVLPTVALVALLVLVPAGAVRGLATARFHGLMLLFVASALTTVLATTLPTLLLAWELMGAMSYALVGYHWRDPEAVSSGTTAFLTTRTADLGLYVAMGAALAGGSGLDLVTLPQASAGWREVAAVGLVVAGLGKAAQLPFSFWLSRAMHGPSPVSALLHSAAMVALGGYLLVRVAPTLAATGWVDDLAAWTGATTAVVLGLVALAQRDLKQLLAASTAAQLGYVVLAAGVGAASAGTAHLVAHAAVKSTLFLAAGLWLEALGTKRLSGLTGAARRWPLVGACAVVALLSLAGLAPLALWATKDAVLTGALKHSPALYAVGLLGAALSAAYAGKALVVLLRRPDVDIERVWDQDRTGTREVPRRGAVVLVPLALGAIVLGAAALPPLAGRLHELAGDRTPEAGPVELLVSALVGLAALGLTVVVTRRGGAVPLPATLVNLLAGWLHLEWAAHRLVVTPVERLAGLLARLDDRVLDRGVESGAALALRLAAVTARADDRVVDAGVGRVVRGARGLGRLAQRPQTGQLHQYYLQALFVICAAVLVLVVVR